MRRQGKSTHSHKSRPTDTLQDPKTTGEALLSQVLHIPSSQLLWCTEAFGGTRTNNTAPQNPSVELQARRCQSPLQLSTEDHDFPSASDDDAQMWSSGGDAGQAPQQHSVTDRISLGLLSDSPAGPSRAWWRRLSTESTTCATRSQSQLWASSHQHRHSHTMAGTATELLSPRGAVQHPNTSPSLPQGTPI